MKILTRLTALFWLITFAPAPAAAAATFCGSFDILTFSTPELKKLLEESSLAVVAGPQTVACGIPGEDFSVCRACEDSLKPDDWEAIRSILADTKHRAWHYDWHRTFQSPQGIDDAEAARLKRRKMMHAGESAEAYANRVAAFAGESFFFMHRSMLKMVQVELTAQGKPCIAPWAKLPSSPYDKKWPMPTAAGSAGGEDEEIYVSQLRSTLEFAAKFENEKGLRGISLNQLGEDVRQTLHTMLHTIYENTPEETALRCVGDPLFSATCDELGNDASSHVNIHFWKLHGYIDSLVGRWLKANGYREISVECDGRAGCYEWKGTYLGSKYSQL
ncbi:MAG: hypothetical protein EOP11_00945 [Proteobacteria bacterium]|nr:MAG: hypothetical protein EOP11_00945 [Pseudomonadota bacterium]